ncbi:type IV secretion system protein [Variovorax sp. Sphag1AA]|uniref:type IV secretion system protein n=1 Tax=Variovorax sp. Sphag1AA TaxID=2587027 RepID=UPI001613FC0F|nr:type IV secretion system protein [Variovorax sp. Sphag1AA]MBB3177523.1 hypothetical protein [Variovorax sp. Sphag1AA]
MPIADASNLTNIGDFVYFALIHNWLSQRIIQFSVDVMGRAMTWVSAIALVLITLWVLIQGYRLITGQSREPLAAVVTNMSRIAVVVSIASTMALGGLQLQEFLTTGLARGINELVTGSAASPVASIDKNLAYTQLAMGAIDAVQVPADDVATARTKARAMLVATLGTAGPAMAAGAMLLLYQVAMALIIGFGPLFVLCLAFNSTKELFHRWLMYGLGTLFSMAVLNLMISMVLELTLRVAGALWGTQALSAITGTNAEGFTSQAMQQGGVGLLMTVLIVSTPPMAAAFFRGVLGQFLSLSAFGFGMGGGGAVGANRRRASQGAAYGQSASIPSDQDDSDGDIASLHRVSWGHTSRGPSNSSSNAALDYMKKHEWSGMSDASVPRTPGERHVQACGDEVSQTRKALDAAKPSGLPTDLPGDRTSELLFDLRLEQGGAAPSALVAESGRDTGLAIAVALADRARAGAVFQDAATTFGAKAVAAYNTGNTAEGNRFLSYAATYSTESANAFAAAGALDADAPRFSLPPAAVGQPHFSIADLSLDTGFTVQIGIGANAAGGWLGGYGEFGIAAGFSYDGLSAVTYTSAGVVLGPQQGASIGLVGAIAQGLPRLGTTTYYGATAFGGAGIGGNVTTLTDSEENLGIGRAATSARLFVGEAVGAGAIRLVQENYPLWKNAK